MIDFQAVSKQLRENESKNKAFVLAETNKKIDEFVDSIDQEQKQTPSPSKNILSIEEWNSMGHDHQVLKAYRSKKPVFRAIERLFDTELTRTMDLRENASNELKIRYKETYVSSKENILSFVNPNRIENVFENEFSVQ